MTSGSYSPYDQPDISNPNRQNMIALAGPTILFALPALLLIWLLASGRTANWLLMPALVGTGIFVIFAVSLLVSWLQGLRQIKRTRDFLASDRPLLRWTYSSTDWQTLREAAWQESRSDWKTQLGCLTALFGLVALLTGVMIGLDEGGQEAVQYGLIGLLGGLLLGAFIGAAIGGSHYLSTRAAYRQTEPGSVALAPHEVYANGHYFRGNNRTTYIKQATLTPPDAESPLLLRLEVRAPLKFRGSSDEEWEVLVPEVLKQDVERILPLLAPPEEEPPPVWH